MTRSFAQRRTVKCGTGRYSDFGKPERLSLHSDGLARESHPHSPVDDPIASDRSRIDCLHGDYTTASPQGQAREAARKELKVPLTGKGQGGEAHAAFTVSVNGMGEEA